MAKRAAVELPAVDPETERAAYALAEGAPLPARVGPVHFGTAGFTDRTLIESGTFYPRGASTPEARLRHYAAHFSLVEIDATYYALLPPELAERWVSYTPASFRFDIKAFPLFTEHPVDVRRLPQDLKHACQELGHATRIYPKDLPAELGKEMASRFLALLRPLQEAGRLGAVLLQFPPWFSASRGNVRRLEALRSEYPELPFAVEFRHASWFEPERQGRIFDVLSQHALSYVCVDEPGLPLVVRVTQPGLAYVRLHGQNAAGFGKRGASVIEKFCYLYHPRELVRWVAPVQQLAREAREVHVLFNNCVRNYAVLGAKDLAVLLAEQGELVTPEGAEAPPSVRS